MMAQANIDGGALHARTVTGFECGVHLGPPIVHVMEGPEQRAETFPAALRMIDQFAEPGRTLLLELQAALERLAVIDPRSNLIWRESAVAARQLDAPLDHNAVPPPQHRPAPLARPAHVEHIALHRVADKLRQAGATLPAPGVTGTIEGAIISGLCIALCLVDAEIQILERDVELAAIKAALAPDELATWEQHRISVREQIDCALQRANEEKGSAN